MRLELAVVAFAFACLVIAVVAAFAVQAGIVTLLGNVL